MTMSRLKCWLIAAALCASLVGCSKKEEAPAASSSSNGAAESKPATAEAVTLRINVDPNVSQEVMKSIAADFGKQSGATVEVIFGPSEATERLAQYRQEMGAKADSTDVYQIDCIWPGVLEEHLVDLNQYFTAKDLEAFFAPLLANNTASGKLVAIPWFADAGILYYRKDLLEKYQFSAPPKTWDELESMAKKIQDGERAAGNADFWGYVFQGKAGETLMCDAIEWMASHGAGRFVEADRSVTVNNPKAIAALERAAGWVGTIAPPGVTTYAEEEARVLFQSGNAAFMRNWPYAYAKGEGDDSKIKGKFGVTVIPSGGGGNAAALGGWQLSVPKYSKHPKEAAEFVKYLTSEAVQKRRALESALLPTRISMYQDAEITKAIPFLADMKDVFLSASPRPSTATGIDYNEASGIIYKNVNKVLTKEQTAAEAVKQMEGDLKTLLQ